MKQIDCVIIPARGGSKRIKRKNMQHFCGIPMLERSIKLGQMVSECVIVSSDDISILEFAKQLGAYPLLRDERLASDITPTLPVITNAILPFIDKEAKEFLKDSNEIKSGMENLLQSNKSSEMPVKIPLKISLHSKVLCLYATAMFATESILLESCQMLNKNPQAAYIIAMIEASKVFRSFTCSNSGFLQFMFPQFMDTRSQDLPQAFFDAGQFYLGFAKSFLSKIPLLGQRSIGICLKYAHDIDTILDLEIAQSLFKHIDLGQQ